MKINNGYNSNDKYESNGVIHDSIFDIDLIDYDGSSYDYFRISEDGTKEKLRLMDLIDIQFLEMKEKSYRSIKRINNTPIVNNDINLIVEDRERQCNIIGDRSKVIINNDETFVSINGNDSMVSSNCRSTSINISGLRSKVLINGSELKLTISDLDSKSIINSNCANVNISGNFAKLLLDGYISRTVITGEWSKVIIKGRKATVYILATGGMIKAIKGTKITLANYSNSRGPMHSVNEEAYTLFGIIGDENYVDCNGKVLSEDETYIVHDNKFCPIINFDGLILIKLIHKNFSDIEIFKCKSVSRFYDNNFIYTVTKNNMYAHAYSIRDAIKDLEWKQLKSEGIDNIIKDIKSSGTITKIQYRAITNACITGMDLFAEENGYPVDKDSISLEELLPILDDGYFGAKQFKKLLNKPLEE